MLFGNKKRIEELEAENAGLRGWYETFGGMDAIRLQQATEAAKVALAGVREHTAAANAELNDVNNQLLEARVGGQVHMSFHVRRDV
jgi:hypothetical protein